jgi:pilus assembly protein Flp/PilA
MAGNIRSAKMKSQHGSQFKITIQEEREMMMKVWNQLRSQKGQGMVEYGLILAAIAVVCVVAYETIGTNMLAKLNSISF